MPLLLLAASWKKKATINLWLYGVKVAKIK